MKAQAGLLRALVGLARGSAWTLAGLVAIVALALTLGLGTGAGRALVVRAGLGIANGVLPGTLELAELERVGPARIVLRGIVIKDAQGEVVARVRKLTLDYVFRELVSGRFVVPSVALEGAWADLRTIAEDERGLVSAFVDPRAPPSPPADPNAPSPYVEVRSATLARSAVLLPELPELGQLELRDVELSGSFLLDGEASAALSAARFGVVRAGASLGRLTDARGEWRAGKKPTSVELGLELLASRLRVKASGVLPPEPSFAEAPLDARVELEGLRAEQVATLLARPGLASAFQGDLGLLLHVSGAARDARVTLEVQTAGGALRAQGRAEDFERGELRLETRDFRGALVRGELPAQPLDVVLQVRADARDKSAIALQVELPDGRLGAHALPAVQASGILAPDELRELALALRDGSSSARARGRVGFDGALTVDADVHLKPHTLSTLGELASLPGGARGYVDAELTATRAPSSSLSARGRASVRGLAVGDDQLRTGDLVFHVQGEPPNLSGTLELKAAGAQLAGQSFERVELLVKGGPSRYHVEADVRGVELAERAKMSARANLELEWSKNHYGASGSVAGTLGDAPLRLTIAPSRYEPRRGAYQSEGVALQLGEGQLLVKGRAEAQKADVEVTSDGPIDLRLLSDLLPLDPPLSGKATVTGRARGSLSVPVVELDAKLERVTLGARPALSGDFRATLDAARGKLGFSGLVQASDKDASGWRPLDLEGTFEHHFQPGARYLQHIVRGRPEGHLELRALNLAFVEAWAGQELPVRGHLGATLDAGGTLQSPTLALSLRSKLIVRGDPRTLDVDGELSLRDERWETRVGVKDGQGPWLTLAADALTPPPSSLQSDPFLSRLALLPAQGRWQVEVEAAPRALSELPVVRLQELPAGTLAGHVELAHEPQAEPNGHVSLILTQSGDSEEYQGCESGDLRIALDLDLEGAAWQLKLDGRRREDELFVSRASGRLELAPALAGEALKLGPIDAELTARSLHLENLPSVCASARGTLNARVQVSDPLGANPALRGDLSLRRFRASPVPPSRGSLREELVDLEAHFAADARRAELEAALSAGKNRSTLRAKLPIHYQNGKVSIAADAPLDAHLRVVHLPISPLLNPRGAVSYASGTVHGQVDLVGTRAAPRLSGTLELEKVAFTATDLAQPLRDVQAKIVFSERDARLEKFEAHDKDGQLQLEGQAHFQALDRVDAQFRVRAQEFPLRQLGQVVAQLDLDAEVKTMVLPERTNVEVGIREADMWLENAKFRSGIALAPHPDFVIDGQAAKGGRNARAPAAAQSGEPPAEPAELAADGADAAPRAADSEQPAGVAARSAGVSAPTAGAAARSAGASAPPAEAPRVTRLVLKSRDRFWIKRDDFAVNLSANLASEIAAERASVEGEVAIERGYLTLIGKTFEFERGSKLTFIGGAAPDPVIDLTAAFNNRRTGDVVKVHITGRGSKPVIEFLINDKRGEAGDAFAAIYGSQGTNQSASSAPQQAAGFVGGLTAGLLATSARRELGAAAPIIMIEPGDKAGEGRVRAGFELDSLVPQFLRDVITGVYVEGILSRESASGTKSTSSSSAAVNYGVLLEFYYPRNFFSTAQYGPGSTWSLDLGWQL